MFANLDDDLSVYSFMGQFYKIDQLIEDFRKTKSTDLESLITILVKTHPIKDYLYSRDGLYAYACKTHGETIFKGLE